MAGSLCPFATSIGAYLLDGLSERDRLSFVAHLDGCPACRADTQELTAVVRQLGQLDATRLTEDSEPEQWQPPARLRASVLGTLEQLESRHRRTSRVRIGLVAAVLAIALGTAGALVLRGKDSDETERFRLLAGPGVQGVPAVSGYVEVGLSQIGTYVRFHARGLPQGQVYRMWFEKPDGSRVPIGSFWPAGAGKWLQAAATAGLERDAVAAVGASNEKGITVLRADFPKAKPA